MINTHAKILTYLFQTVNKCSKYFNVNLDKSIYNQVKRKNGAENMFKVVLYKTSDDKDIYETKYLQYAKRYADLYRQDYPFIEIKEYGEGNEETVIETFGKRLSN